MPENLNKRPQLTLADTILSVSLVCLSFAILRILVIPETWVSVEFEVLLFLVVAVSFYVAIGGPMGRILGNPAGGALLAFVVLCVVVVIMQMFVAPHYL